MERYTADLFLEVRTSMSYISPSSTSEGSTRRFDLTTRVQTRSHNQQLLFNSCSLSCCLFFVTTLHATAVSLLTGYFAPGCHASLLLLFLRLDTMSTGYAIALKLATGSTVARDWYIILRLDAYQQLVYCSSRLNIKLCRINLFKRHRLLCILDCLNITPLLSTGCTSYLLVLSAKPSAEFFCFALLLNLSLQEPSAESYEGKMLSYQLMQTISFCNRQLQTPTTGCTATGYFLYDVASSLALLFITTDSSSSTADCEVTADSSNLPSQVMKEKEKMASAINGLRVPSPAG
ncbi:hypothetical protein F511_31119 [Dorcoceras hygrometricum]|uniref:Uncharacterized protein n=1 Tax=Dorcoceras hygrometricum TaxID=472368 RepID=A0A2Z7AG45_9LAMI|nr:hypothetical protein F511_31119 [Dorcoceras hygrometricum]